MKILLLCLGLVSAGAGAVFIAIAIWLFGSGSVRSILEFGLWAWIGLHALFALLSLVFFRLFASASTAEETDEGEAKL